MAGLQGCGGAGCTAAGSEGCRVQGVECMAWGVGSAGGWRIEDSGFTSLPPCVSVDRSTMARQLVRGPARPAPRPDLPIATALVTRGAKDIDIIAEQGRGTVAGVVGRRCGEVRRRRCERWGE